ncbi:MAG: CPBP family intramembrane metalloprotease [Chloroflexi bacterium]|nr:CPBP family intramembrane metalloprotease [Chloroflexota bacterium]
MTADPGRSPSPELFDGYQRPTMDVRPRSLFDVYRPEPPPWRWYDLVGVLVGGLILSFAVSVPLALVTLALADNPAAASLDPNSPILFAGGAILQTLSFLVVTWVVLRGRQAPLLASLGFDRLGRWPLWLVLVVAVGVALLSDLLSLLAHQPLQPPEFAAIYADRRGWPLLLVGVGLVGPLGEEILFRGLLYRTLASRFGVWTAIALVVVFFTVIHVTTYGANAWALIQVGIGAIALTLVRAWTGSLVPSTAMHATLNVYSTLQGMLFTALGWW